MTGSKSLIFFTLATSVYVIILIETLFFPASIRRSESLNEMSIFLDNDSVATSGNNITFSNKTIVGGSAGNNVTASNLVPGIAVTSVGSGTGLTGGPITSTGTLSLTNTGVTAGNYTLMGGTVDSQGRLTSASSGTAVTSVGSGTGLTGGPITSTGTLALATYGVASTVYSPRVTTDAYGRSLLGTIGLETDVMFTYTTTYTAGGGTKIITPISPSSSWPIYVSPNLGGFNQTTGKFTCAKAGFYTASCTHQFQANATGYRQAQIIYNTSTVSNSVLAEAVNTNVSASFSTAVNVSSGIYLNVNDQIWFTLYNGSGSTLSVTTIASILFLHE